LTAGAAAEAAPAVSGADVAMADNRRMGQRAELLRALERARAEAEGRVAEFEEAVASIVRSRGDDTDDEHDPDGTTLSWERALHVGTVDTARAHLAEIDAAIARLRSGWDGSCEACGRPIARERLAARPSACRCVTCASQDS
jgi:RNA polymerase-binding transcription factor DksA